MPGEIKDEGDNLVGRCEDVIKRATEMGVASAEAFIQYNKFTSLQLEKDQVKFTTSSTNLGMAIRVIMEGKIGFSYSSDFNNIDKMIESAIKTSRFFKSTPIQFSSGGKFLSPTKFYNKKVDNFPVEDGFEVLQRLISSAKEVGEVVITSGGLSWGSEVFALATAEGLSRYDANTRMGLFAYSVYSYAKGLISPGFDMEVKKGSDIHPESVGKNAAEVSIMGAHPKKLDKTVNMVLFKPYAMSNLLEFLTIPALYGDRAYKGESFYPPKVDVNNKEDITSPTLNIFEDPLFTEGINSSTMDDEGVPSKRVQLVRKGNLMGYLHTLSSEGEDGVSSTASAVRAERLSTSHTYHTPPTTCSRRFRIEGTNSLKEPLSEVDRGLWIHDVLGAHTSNAVSGDFSVSSSTLFYVENGEVKYPLKSIMLSGNMKRVLRSVNLIGSDHKEIPGSLTAVGLSIPTIGITGVNIII